MITYLRRILRLFTKLQTEGINKNFFCYYKGCVIIETSRLEHFTFQVFAIADRYYVSEIEKAIGKKCLGNYSSLDVAMKTIDDLNSEQK